MLTIQCLSEMSQTTKHKLSVTLYRWEGIRIGLIFNIDIARAIYGYLVEIWL